MCDTGAGGKGQARTSGEGVAGREKAVKGGKTLTGGVEYGTGRAS
jgi:hypothetical protein